MLPQKIFENLQTVMIILALFEQFSGQVDRWPATDGWQLLSELVQRFVAFS